MESSSLGNTAVVCECILLSFPSRGFLATLRAVNRSWHQRLHELLRLPDVRRSLGCHHWDGSLACRKVDLACPAGMSVEHASWVPGTGQLLCVCFPEHAKANNRTAHGEFRVFGFDGMLENVILIDDLSGYLVDICFTDHLRFVCAASGNKEMVVMHVDLEGLSMQSACISLELGGPDIVIGGRSMPKLSPDGLLVADPVYLTDVSVARTMQQDGFGMNPDDEDYWDGEDDLGSFIVMVEVQTRHTLWKASFGMQSNAIGFIRAGLLISGEQSGNQCLYLVETLTGARLNVFQTINETHARPHYCISPDRLHIVDGHFILRIVPDDANSTFLAQQVRLELPVGDVDDATFEWSLDGSRLFCIRGKYDKVANLDVFDAKTGSLLWRRSAGLGLGSYCEAGLSISSDGCCLAVTKHGVPVGDGNKDYGIRLFIPAIIPAFTIL